METLFQVCFGVGAAMTILSFVFGELFETFDVDLDFFDGPAACFMPLGTQTFFAFVTVFGGVGMLTNELTLAARWGTALASGLLVSFLLNRFLIRPLKQGESTTTVEAKKMTGVQAKALSSMKGDELGEISYRIKGIRHRAPARCFDQGEIHTGDDVVIIKVEKQINLVAKI
ncbi:hypothetical protein GTO89_12105 [Heliobacterium gestii]|uniref:Membrane protein NfeD2 N-terminal transmembrane domain-containing protein n=1 Tax=Heliomicrobium gestii TaxID=2699 RepID=A0A845LAK8_HELGE|nr:hypothetical protein [Heliomicrobium gestii]MBM7867232.1 membrane protein implicated in regulation of membrane protease activity [Heliomicrobium gestii]MZP43787.1 hypothetical protein [Heliomicrobium gestii]